MPKFSEKVEIEDPTADRFSLGTRITLDGERKNIIIKDRYGKDAIILDGNSNFLQMINKARESSIFLNGDTGELNLADPKNYIFPGTIRLHGGGGYIGIGGYGKDGRINIRNKKSDGTIYLNGADGDMTIFGSDGRRSFALRGIGKDYAATIWLGASASDNLPNGPKAGVLVIRDNAGKDSIIMNGVSGDIVLQNADCAEDFEISNSTEIEPGTVMVIEQEGKLKECDIPYDNRVAGVISGAGNYKPGLVLDKRKSNESRKSISLMGKVHCKVDAQSASIDVGDLLTTSDTPGHAMKATDPLKAFGAVIGKALHPLKTGKGLIPILIALQ